VLAHFRRIRRIEFSDLPKTISGKIRRVDLRHREAENVQGVGKPEFEFREEDFPVPPSQGLRRGRLRMDANKRADNRRWTQIHADDFSSANAVLSLPTLQKPWSIS
jgi:hypothetical protein